MKIFNRIAGVAFIGFALAMFILLMSVLTRDAFGSAADRFGFLGGFAAILVFLYILYAVGSTIHAYMTWVDDGEADQLAYLRSRIRELEAQVGEEDEDAS